MEWLLHTQTECIEFHAHSFTQEWNLLSLWFICRAAISCMISLSLSPSSFLFAILFLSASRLYSEFHIFIFFVRSYRHMKLMNVWSIKFYIFWCDFALKTFVWMWSIDDNGRKYYYWLYLLCIFLCDEQTIYFGKYFFNSELLSCCLLLSFLVTTSAIWNSISKTA